MTKSSIQKLPDPHGMIARVKARLPKNCAVKISPFCEIIISMAMQGIAYREIEAWLIKQGEEHRISAPTIWRNLKQSKLKVLITHPYGEELAEQWGGRIDLDVARDLAAQILAQRDRVEKMQAQERERQQRTPAYFDRRIRHERETLNDMYKTLHGMMKSPIEAAREAAEARALLGTSDVSLTKDAADVLKDMLLSGELAFGDGTPTLHRS